MKKVAILLAMLLMSFTLFAAEDEVLGDASGNDLQPIVRGINLSVFGGVVTMLGNGGGDNSQLFGSVYGLAVGYDHVFNKVGLGFDLAASKMLVDTKPYDQGGDDNSPWVEDFSPFIVGLDVNCTYLITERLQLGLNVGFDYYLDMEVLDKDAKGSDLDPKTVENTMAAGGGLVLEYYTYSRFFSIGVTADFNYFLGIDAMAATVTPFMKYTF